MVYRLRHPSRLIRRLHLAQHIFRLANDTNVSDYTNIDGGHSQAQLYAVLDERVQKSIGACMIHLPRLSNQTRKGTE